MIRAGTAFRRDHGTRHPHDLGTVPASHPGERTGQPVIDQPSRHYAEALGGPWRDRSHSHRAQRALPGRPDRGPPDVYDLWATTWTGLGARDRPGLRLRTRSGRSFRRGPRWLRPSFTSTCCPGPMPRRRSVRTAGPLSSSGPARLHPASADRPLWRLVDNHGPHHRNEQIGGSVRVLPDLDRRSA